MTELHSFSVPVRITALQNGVVVFERTFKNGPVSFGRTTKNDVTLEYEFVSRSHCILYEKGGKFYLEDLRSSNGITVQEHKVSKIEVPDVFEFSIVSVTIKIEKQVDEDTQPAIEPISESSERKLLPTLSTASHEVPPPPSKHSKQPQQPEKHKPAIEKPSLPEAAGITQARSTHKKYTPVLGKDFTAEFTHVHAGVGAARSKKMEAVIMWHDQVYDVTEFGKGERVIAGRGPDANIPVPMQQDWTLAKIGSDGTQCYIPPNKDVTVIKNGRPMAMGDLIAKQILKPRAIGYTMKLSLDEVLKLDMGSSINVIFRYVPASRELTKARLTEPERSFKQAIFSSAVLHFFLAFMMIISAPKDENVPKIKNVPERYARLLMEKPKPKPTPKPAPAPEKKVVEKKPEPRKQEIVKVKPKIFKTPKVVAKVNKFPMEVKHPIPKAPPPVKVENLGALGALGPISKTAQPNVVTNININPNAGGMASAKINTGGIAGALPSSNGTLVAAGMNSTVKTKGMGYGTGTGYGIQGLKGTAGSRGVAGAIVGEPKLASIAKEEGLTRAQVMAVVQKYLGEVQHCYERNLLASPNLSGRMEFEWDISPSGSVTSVRVKRSTVSGGDSLGECVKSVFASMKFPKATNGATTTPNIGFPFGRL